MKSLAVLTATLLAFASCQQEIDPIASGVSHTLKFVASAPETKTEASFDGTIGGTVEYTWSNGDDADGKFQVWEIVEGVYKAATKVDAVLEEGVMVLEANFSGAATSGSQYVALFNKGVRANQGGTDTSYDQNSDVLVSEVVTSENIEKATLELRFARKNAFALMTAKEIEGAFIGKAVITADQVIAADFSVETGAFAETGSKTIVVADQDDETMPISEIVDNKANVFFSTLPVKSAKLSVGVVTVDEDGEFQAVYEKSFAEGASISFPGGDIRPFNITMNKATGLTLNLSIDETTTATADEMTWVKPFVTVSLSKGTSSTDANNYYPGKSTYTSTRFYDGQVLTISPKLGVPIKEIVFESTTEGYATALKNSTWANATAVASGKVVTIVPEDGTKGVTAKIGATTGQTSIKISYGKSEPIRKRSITIDTNIENGSVTASATSDITPGTEITLTATPATGYVLDEWNVTNAATSEEIEVVNNKFTMPNADVLVSATFKVASLSGTVTINTENSGVTGSYATKTFTVDGFTFGCTDWMKSTNIQAKKSTAYSLYNATAFPSPIKKITFVQTGEARAIKVYGGTSEKPSTEITAPTTALTMVFDFSGKDYTYFSMTTPGNAVYFDSITIEYEAVKTVTSVAVTGDASKKEYKAGDKFDVAGLVATATFDDASTKDVTADATWSVTPETLTAGTTSVSVKATYKDVTSAAFTVSGLSVTEPAVLSSISVKAAPTKVSYTVGDKFDPTGLVITRHFSDGTSDDYAYAGHTSDFTFSPALTTALAETDTKVTITYKEKTVDQEISVTVPTFASLEELVAAELTSGTIVKVSFENVPIKSIYVTGQYRNGIYFDIQKGGKDIEIYYQNVPAAWVEGGTVSGTMTCPWKLYSGTWELAPDKDTWDWNNLTYTAPLEPCATPEITISNTGSATITCATSGAAIYYTLGTSPADPTSASTRYTGAVTMTDGQTIKAIAYKDGMRASAVASQKYQVGGDTYTLCTSTSDLVAGGTYIIVSGTSGVVKCMSNEENANNRRTVEATVVNNTITLDNKSTVLTLKLGGSTGAWTLETLNYAGTDGYLASAASGNNNYCRVISTSTTCTITFSSNAAVITLNPHASRNKLRYNSSSNLFACYSGNQADVYLFKKN